MRPPPRHGQSLDVSPLETQTAKRFEISAHGFRALRKWLAPLAGTRVVLEATGPYHRAFEKAFSGGLPLVQVNPLQARRFAQACGTRVKTDAVDARLLARMGSALALVADEPMSEKLHDLRDLQIARTALTRGRTPLRNRGHVQTNTLLKTPDQSPPDAGRAADRRAERRDRKAHR